MVSFAGRGKMKNYITIAALFWLCGMSSVWSEVNVTFPVTAEKMRHLRTLSLHFTVDGEGTVTLDAQSSNPNPEAQAVVNAWDGPVGRVDDPRLFNRSFTLTGQAEIGGVTSEKLNVWAGGSQGLYINEGSRIDGVGEEELVWKFSGAGRLTIEAVEYVNRAAHGSSNLVFADVDTRKLLMLPKTAVSGSINLSDMGFALSNGDHFVVTTQQGDVLNASAGAAFYGMKFRLEPHADQDEDQNQPVITPIIKPVEAPRPDAALGLLTF